MTSKSGQLYKLKHSLIGKPKWSIKQVHVYDGILSYAGDTSKELQQAQSISPTSSTPTSHRFFSFVSSPTAHKPRVIVLKHYTLKSGEECVSPTNTKLKPSRRYLIHLIPKDKSQKSISLSCDGPEEFISWVNVMGENMAKFYEAQTPKPHSTESQDDKPDSLHSQDQDWVRVWCDVHTISSNTESTNACDTHGASGIIRLARRFEKVASTHAKHLIERELRKDSEIYVAESSETSVDCNKDPLVVHHISGVTYYMPRVYKMHEATRDNSHEDTEKCIQLFNLEFTAASQYYKYYLHAHTKNKRVRQDISTSLVPLQCIVEWMGYRVYARAARSSPINKSSALSGITHTDSKDTERHSVKESQEGTNQLCPDSISVCDSNKTYVTSTQNYFGLDKFQQYAFLYDQKPNVQNLAPQDDDMIQDNLHAMADDSAFVADRYAREYIIPSFVNYLEAHVILSNQYCCLKTVMHEAGLKVRMLGQCFLLSKCVWVKQALLIEMIARSCKILFRSGLRKKLAYEFIQIESSSSEVLRNVAEELREDFASLILDIENSLSQSYWDEKIFPLLLCKFDLNNIESEKVKSWREELVPSEILTWALRVQLRVHPAHVKSLFSYGGNCAYRSKRTENEDTLQLRQTLCALRGQLKLLAISDVKDQLSYDSEDRLHLYLCVSRILRTLSLKMDSTSVRQIYQRMARLFLELALSKIPKSHLLHAHAKIMSISNFEAEDAAEFAVMDRTAEKCSEEASEVQNEQAISSIQLEGDGPAGGHIDDLISSASEHVAIYHARQYPILFQFECATFNALISKHDINSAIQHLSRIVVVACRTFSPDSLYYAKCCHYQGLFLSNCETESLSIVVDSLDSAAKIYERWPACHTLAAECQNLLANAYAQRKNSTQSFTNLPRALFSFHKFIKLQRVNIRKDTNIVFRLLSLNQAAEIALAQRDDQGAMQNYQKVLRGIGKISKLHPLDDTLSQLLIDTAPKFLTLYRSMSNIQSIQTISQMQKHIVPQIDSYFADKVDATSKHISTIALMLTDFMLMTLMSIYDFNTLVKLASRHQTSLQWDEDDVKAVNAAFFGQFNLRLSKQYGYPSGGPSIIAQLAAFLYLCNIKTSL